MAGERPGMYFECDSDESLEENEDPDQGNVSDSSDEPGLMITNEVMQYVLSKDRRIYWMMNSFNTGEEESLPPSKTFVSTPTIYSISSITDVRSAFRLYLNHSITDAIIMNTNKEGRKVFGSNWTDLTEESLDAFMGLLFLGGIFQSHGESVKKLWNAGTGRQIFRAAMSLKIFLQITRVLRFDSDYPAERDAKDELAPVRDVWDRWVQLLPKYFNAGNNVTIGEQIIGFKGLYPIKQFSSTNSSQVWIRLLTLCDSKTSYVLKSQICTGKMKERDSKKDENMLAVLRLTQGLKYRNVTCNRVYTSYPLAQTLLRRKLTLLGTISGYKPELPPMEANKEAFSSDFYFTKDTTLVHYSPKRNHSIYVLSTKHKKGQVSGEEHRKPVMYSEYEDAKAAVDRLEKEITPYTCKRKTKFWATMLFYHILDTSAYNAFVLWMEVFPTWKGNKIQHKRRMFLEELGKMLILPYMASRKNFPETEEALALLRHLQEKCGYCPAGAPSKSPPKKKIKCKHCNTKKCGSKTSVKCASCKKYLCKEHAIYICSDCEPQT